MALQPTYVNGKYYDHAGLRLSLPFGNNESFTLHTKSIEYSHDTPQTPIHGVHYVPLGFASGAYAAKGSITVIKEGWETFLSNFAPDTAIASLIFDVSLQYVSNNDSYQSSVVKFKNFTIHAVSHSSTLGSGGLEVKLDFVCTQLFEGVNEISLVPTDLDRITTTI